MFEQFGYAVRQLTEQAGCRSIHESKWTMNDDTLEKISALAILAGEYGGGPLLPIRSIDGSVEFLGNPLISIRSIYGRAVEIDSDLPDNVVVLGYNPEQSVQINLGLKVKGKTDG